MAYTTEQLLEGFSLAGTFMFSQQADAEGVAAMLGLSGAFPMETDEGLFWMPGKSYDELTKRIFSNWILPDKAPVPQTFSQSTEVSETLMNFTSFIKHERKYQ